MRSNYFHDSSPVQSSLVQSSPVNKDTRPQMHVCIFKEFWNKSSQAMVFNSPRLISFMEMKLENIHSAPYHPVSNWAMERFVRPSRRDERSLQYYLDSFLLLCQTVPLKTIGQASFSPFLSRSLQTSFALLKPDVEGTSSHTKSVSMTSIRRREPCGWTEQSNR